MFEQETAKLATAIRKVVTEYKEKNLPTQRVVRVRRRDWTLRYRADSGFANLSTQRVEENIWEWSDQHQFHNSVIKGLEEYQYLVSLVNLKSGLVEGFRAC